MSDTTKYACDYAKRKSNCKKCKQPIDKGNARIAKIVPNHFNNGEGEMKMYHHIPCMFEVFKKMRATTKKIEHVTDLDGFCDLEDQEKDLVRQLLSEMSNETGKKNSASAPKRKGKADTKPTPVKQAKIEKKQSSPQDVKPKIKQIKVEKQASSNNAEESKLCQSVPVHSSKDDKFREFRRLCGMVSNESSYLKKTDIFKQFFNFGTSGKGFEGDLYTLVKLLIPGAIKRTYNLQSRQLVKLFSQIFKTDLDEMTTDLEQGDVAETVSKFFQQSQKCFPQKKSDLTIHKVDKWLDKLSLLTHEDEQVSLLTKIARHCTVNDLQTVIRLIKSDLKIQAGPKHVLDALDPNAHEAFKASQDLADVLDRIKEKKLSGKQLEVRAVIMTPVAPMLAEPCKSVEQAMKKCPKGMFSEIKYDGERVQLHKNGADFFFYSRSLKPVQKHKIAPFEEYIPKAFPHGHSAILDSEVLLIDRKTGNPLPFGTLGIHKKAKFSEANVCLFVFDILHFNGENLMGKSMRKRRAILEQNMTEIPNRVMLSEMKHITRADDLKNMIAHVIEQGLEGLVLKDVAGVYEPGKRHWLKVKKDYLLQGKMADSADLVVLGAYFGTGNKGGMMSVFLMGCYDEKCKRWCTVTKVGNGHDDSTLESINKSLKVYKIGKDHDKVPTWLYLNRQYVPDFVVEDPKTAPVWEITGTEFSKSDLHTAGGISIRFPRVTKIRDDKTWKNATSLKRMHELYKKSKEQTDVSALLNISKKKQSAIADCDFDVAKIDFLNDKFDGARVFVPDDAKKAKEWRKFVISCNGELIDDYQLEIATHAVASPTTHHLDLPSDVKMLTAKDLKALSS